MNIHEQSDPSPETNDYISWEYGTQQGANHGEELLQSVDRDTFELGYGLCPPSRMFVDTRKCIMEQQKQVPPQQRQPFIIFAVGNSNRGKTTLLRQGLHHIFSSNTERVIEDETRQKPPPIDGAIIFELSWGDAFYGLDESIRVKTSYYDEATNSGKEELMRRKKIELQAANRNLEKATEASVLTAQHLAKQGEERPIIIMGDLPLQTGITHKDCEIGMNRGEKLLKQISNRQGIYRSIPPKNDKYLGIYTSRGVFWKAVTDRQIISDPSQSLTQVIKSLEANGTTIDIGDKHERGIYLDPQQSATPDEALELEKDAVKVIQYLINLGEVRHSKPLTFQDYLPETQVQKYDLFKYLNAQTLQWILKEHLQLNDNKVALAANEHVLDRIHIVDPNLEIERHRPLLEKI